MVDDGDLAEVVRRERHLLDPVVRMDGRRVQELLHPDFVEFGSSGRVWDRDTMAAALNSDPDVSGAAGDFDPVALSDTVVLLTYRIQGGSASRRRSVWVREPGRGWVLRFHQGTRVRPGSGT